MTARRVVAAGAGAVALALLAGGGWVAWQAGGGAARGAALFTGEAPLRGRLVGHDSPLPPLATRCANCHAAPAPASAAASAPYATVLDGAALKTPRVRRGGPASAFDAERLCALLRNGTDPAHVMISTTMPRYEIDDADCRALWAHLTLR